LSSTGTIVGGTIDNTTINNATLQGSTTNTGTISGGTISGLTISSTTLAGTITNIGTISNAAGTISGGIVSGATLAGGTTFSGALTNLGTISGGTISGATLSNTTTNSGTISGGTISSATINNSSLNNGNFNVSNTSAMNNAQLRFGSIGDGDYYIGHGGGTTLNIVSKTTHDIRNENGVRLRVDDNGCQSYGDIRLGNEKHLFFREYGDNGHYIRHYGGLYLTYSTLDYHRFLAGSNEIVLHVTDLGMRLNQKTLFFHTADVASRIEPQAGTTFIDYHVGAAHRLFVNGVHKFTVDGTGGYTVSDQKLKYDIQSLDSSLLNSLIAIRSVSYKNKTFNQNAELVDDPNSPLCYGFIAQEVEEHIPSIVSESTYPNGFTSKMLNYNAFIPILWKIAQELKQKNDELEARIAQLENGN
jgi:hypothetical protein